MKSLFYVGWIVTVFKMFRVIVRRCYISSFNKNQFYELNKSLTTFFLASVFRPTLSNTCIVWIGYGLK